MIDVNYAFGKYGDVFVAFTAKNQLYYADSSSFDLLQDGRDTYWIFEISSKDKEGNFGDFMKRIKSNDVINNKDVLTYQTAGQNIKMKYGKDFEVNGEKIDTNYKRFESKYATVDRKPEKIEIKYNDHSLLLDFYNNQRVVK